MIFILEFIKKIIFCKKFAIIRRLLPLRFQEKFLNIPQKNITTSEYCYNKKIQYEILRCGEKSLRNLPDTPESKIHWKFSLQNEILHEHPNVWLTRLPEAIVVGPYGDVLTNERTLLIDASLQLGLKNASDHRIFSKFALPRCKRRKHVYSIISGPGGCNNLFHWLTDALPRLAIVKKHHLEIHKYLVPRLHLPVAKESLNLLGLGTHQYEEMGIWNCLQVQELILPSPPGRSGNPPAWVRNFLRDSFLPIASKVTDQFPKRIYIARKGKRRVLNEHEILPILDRYKIQLVSPDNLSLIQQVALFSKAGVVVGPHGAGLTNLIFCQQYTKVVELFSPNYVNVCYWAISELGKLKYSYILGEGKRPPEGYDPHSGSEGMIISPQKIDQWLSHFLKNIEDKT